MGEKEGSRGLGKVVHQKRLPSEVRLATGNDSARGEEGEAFQVGSTECRSMGVKHSACLELVMVLYQNRVLEIETKGEHSPTDLCGVPLAPCCSSPGYRDPCTYPAGRGFPPPILAAPPQCPKGFRPQGSSWSLKTPKEKTENRAPSLGLAAL